jgi:hypothetical protein
MAEKPKCALCGKDVIGFPSIGCGFMNICQDHADSHILALRPGEKQSVGECFFFERFGTTDS